MAQLTAINEDDTVNIRIVKSDRQMNEVPQSQVRPQRGVSFIVGSYVIYDPSGTS